MDKKEKDGLALQVYKDTLQPAGKVVGRTIQVALAPLRAMLWGAEKIEQIVHEGVERRLAKTPEEKIQTPAPEIAVPILQALVYTGENDELREMYLNLLATAMDSRKEKFAHRSYVTITSQLSPLDTKVLAEFRPKTPLQIGTSISNFKRYIVKDGREIRVDSDDNEIDDIDEDITLTNTNFQLIGYNFPKTPRAIATYLAVEKANGNVKIIQDNVVKTAATEDISLISASITNLARLGLIEINYGMHAKSNNNEDLYKCFSEKPLLPNWQEALVHPLINAIEVKGVPTNYDYITQNNRFEIKKGIAQLTQFGFNFMSACVLESEFVEE